MHGYFDEWMAYCIILGPIGFFRQFWGLFGQASGLYKQAGVEPGNEEGREDPGTVYNKNERDSTASVNNHFSACIPSSIVMLYSRFGFPPYFSDICLGTRILLCYNELPRSKCGCWSGGQPKKKCS